MDSLTHLLLAALLVAVLVGVWHIHRQFQRLRDSYRRLESMLLALAQAERHANVTLESLRSASDEMEQNLGTRMRRISRLVDQLELMSRAGDALATRLAKAGRDALV